jgi:HEPN domain-containing protein
MESDWNWSLHPASDAEFDSMMSSLDDHLAKCGHQPFRRPMQAEHLVSVRLGVSAVLSGPLSMGVPRTRFGPKDLLLRVGEWYEQNYGKRLRPPFRARSFAIDIRGTLWRVRLPIVFGTVTVFVDRNLGKDYRGGALNILQSIDGFTQAYANRLHDEEIERVGEESHTAYLAIEVLNGLSRHAFFEQARMDYEHSIDALISGFSWSKARWETAQCVEKILKGLLATAGHEYPSRGGAGHDIPRLGEIVSDKLGLALNPDVLRKIHCEPKVRYGEESASPEEAFMAHTALLGVMVLIGRKLSVTEEAE